MRVAAFLLLIFFSVQFPLYAGEVSKVGTEVGRHAPTFELPDLDGKPVKLEALRGQVVLLNFWSTLCAPCMAEMPSLNRLSSALQDKGLRVVSVAVDSKDKPVREYVQKNGISFLILLDTEKEVFFDDYAGPSLPATYLLDRNGVIVEKFHGLQVWDAAEMKDRILQLLQKR